jgi:hypothetical protein
MEEGQITIDKTIKKLDRRVLSYLDGSKNLVGGVQTPGGPKNPFCGQGQRIPDHSMRRGDPKR